MKDLHELVRSKAEEFCDEVIKIAMKLKGIGGDSNHCINVATMMYQQAQQCKIDSEDPESVATMLVAFKVEPYVARKAAELMEGGGE